MFSISIVVYKPKREIFEKVLESISSCLCEDSPLLKNPEITIIDNSNQKKRLETTIKQYLGGNLQINIVSNVKNIGYGRAHNLAILKSTSNYHLILNPDVVLRSDALKVGLEYLQDNRDVVAISPKCFDDNNEVQYIAKTYPSVLVLFLRGIAPKILRNIFYKNLHKYEEREKIDNDKISEIEMMSGCFMLCRTEALKKINGFDSRYFLYFEDFAMSLELSKLGKLMYVPSMKIIHFGGYAARKGLLHIFYFVCSSIRFFNQYGWKIL